MIYLKKCPLCSGKSFTSKLSCIDHTKSKESFKIVSCETCGFTLTNPRPNNKDLPNYYKSEMYISHTNSKHGLFNWVYQKVRSYTIKSKVSLIKKTKTRGALLDVGSGTGEFLFACKNAGLDPYGIEPSKKAREQAIKNYDLKISSNPKLSQYTNGKFDSITMWHVLEHISELDETISEAKRILKKDGKIIIAVPNHNSWDAKYYKEYWAAWDVPIHLWHFSKATIQKLLNKHGFVLTKTKPMVFDAFYVSILSEEFATGKKKFIKGMLIGLISNAYAFIKKTGYSSSTYVFEKKTNFRAF